VAVPALGVIALGGCAGRLSVLDGATVDTIAIAELWWVMLLGSVIVLLGVGGLCLLSLRKRRPARSVPISAYLLGGGILLPGVTVALLVIYAFVLGEDLTVRREPALRVEARGHQWWWEFVYELEDGSRYGANVLHLPAGQPVEVRVTSADVIHSFWIPRISFKLDAIPGQVNVIRLPPAPPGSYGGVCAEFCGAQHAHMHFQAIVHADPDWPDILRAEAAAANDHPGAGPFQDYCAGCHALDRRERSMAAPHLAGLDHRAFLGGGAIGNDGARALRRFVREHQILKPGSRKPPLDHVPDEALDLIVDYLAPPR
jgi:cytochrome c oxidase subunit 2